MNMAVQRAHRKTEGTAEASAGLHAGSKRLRRDRPPPENPASAARKGPYRHGDVMALLSTIAALKQERERQGLTLAEISGRSGLDKGMLSRLENGKVLNGFTAEAMEALEGYGWPGNVRELDHTVERAVLMARGSRVEISDLGLHSQKPAGQSLDEMSIEAVEEILIRKALARTGGNVSHAADALGLALCGKPFCIRAATPMI